MHPVFAMHALTTSSDFLDSVSNDDVNVTQPEQVINVNLVTIQYVSEFSH